MRITHKPVVGSEKKIADVHPGSFVTCRKGDISAVFLVTAKRENGAVVLINRQNAMGEFLWECNRSVWVLSPNIIPSPGRTGEIGSFQGGDVVIREGKEWLVMGRNTNSPGVRMWSLDGKETVSILDPEEIVGSLEYTLEF